MSDSFVQTPEVVSTDARHVIETDGGKGIASPAPEDFKTSDGSTNHTSNIPPNQIVSDAQHRADEELAVLRSLLLSPEQTHLQHLQERLDTLEVTAEDVANVLPEAVKAQTANGERLSIVMTPLIERALRVWIKRNPQVFIDILFPLIGATIRRAISNALGEMLQSFNQTLEHSFSPQSFRWRLESWRTGKSFAEVVMLHTLKYRVEQIFLIHRETGLLLQHVVSPASSSTQDADMVSGMMSAINDFAHDSFDVEQSETLNSFQVGGLTMWIEQTPLVTLAALIRGNAPPEFRTRLQQTLENVHLQHRTELENFQGDASVFDPARAELEELLEAHSDAATEADAKGKKRGSPVLWLLGGASLGIVLLAAWFFSGYINGVRWQRYLERLRAQSGIVVTHDERRDGKFIVAGLRDPLAVAPQTLLEGTGLDPNNVNGHWEEYQSLESKFVLARATRILAPPDAVQLNVENGILTARGTAAAQWIEDARRLARAIPGVTQYKDDQLREEKTPDVEVQTTPKQLIPTLPKRRRFRRHRLRRKVRIAPLSNGENPGGQNQTPRQEQKLP
ncbi:MAG: hypothetical protein NVSMB56_04380 [Pyrinomonadaceae bacterium]